MYSIPFGLSEMAIKTAKDRNIGVIGFSGGVGYNGTYEKGWTTNRKGDWNSVRILIAVIYRCRRSEI